MRGCHCLKTLRIRGFPRRNTRNLTVGQPGSGLCALSRRRMVDTIQARLSALRIGQKGWTLKVKSASVKKRVISLLLCAALLLGGCIWMTLRYSGEQEEMIALPTRL